MIKEIIQMYKERKDRKFKSAMCRKTIDSGTCPRSCANCEWSWYIRKNGGSNGNSRI